MIDESAARALHRQVRVLCWIPSTEKQLNSKVRAVNDTWVKRCDGHVFFVDTQHHNASSDVIELGVKDGRGHLTEKSVAALAYVYEKYGKDYDWFLKGDDDAYVVVENLKFLLSHYNPNTPVYLGHLYKWHLREGYMSGGASYVLSREALRLLNVNGIRRNKCRLTGDEDVEIGRCLHDVGVSSHNTLDRFGRETFHPLNPTTHIGADCCSQLSISFHKVNPDLMRVVDHLLYRTSVYGRNLDMKSLQLHFMEPGIVPPP
ncbi:hypothetical protein BaRGS_00031155 [Batillaria attramentaria]|uniref:N-acetylgalactosaminide beta-1,3-galactosyltransferase n=1 Tax=Batillaria attramentaria TaxID=370345 RepID=A0ABD0JRN4_9CAEN